METFIEPIFTTFYVLIGLLGIILVVVAIGALLYSVWQLIWNELL